MMRQTRMALLALSLAPLAACADVRPQTAPQGAYEAMTGFAAALKTANAYTALPRCSTAQPQPCSTQDIARKISAAAYKANIAANAMESIARDTTSSETAQQQAIEATNRAVVVLTALIPQ